MAAIQTIMNIDLKYGKTELSIDFPENNITVIEPDFVAGLPDEKQAFFEALHHPIGTVPLNKDHAITGVFAGAMDQAHTKGVEFVKKTVMQPVESPFDIVVTTNSGYPLDLNLYQTFKGISAARQIVKQGGSIIAVSECSNGIPEGGHYQKILHSASSVQELLDTISTPGYSHIDQWGAQIQAMILQWADIYVYSSLPADDVRRCHVEPIASIETCVDELMEKYGSDTSIAVLPEGPQTIPYLST